ncbi:acyl-CoA thioesterase [Haloarcula marismortui]|uniref:acyl-CoA thioesterase n=1 Tax=Haloarcula marismortui TaxID=2238 RepID=UPI003C77727B
MPTVLKTYIENRWMVQPNHSNHLGSTHGGNVLKWMDELGAMSAMRFAGETCVTARMDQVNFKRPIPVGDTALIEAFVYDAGETSVKVRLRAARENIRTGETESTAESYSVYVAVDEDRNPVPVPDVATETDRGEQLRQRALDGEANR